VWGPSFDCLFELERLWVFALLGRWSIPIGWASAIWLTLTSVLFFFPSTYPVNAQNMNYTIVVVGATMIICLFFWVVTARKWFVGPKRKGEENMEITVKMTAEPPTTEADGGVALPDQ